MLVFMCTSTSTCTHTENAVRVNTRSNFYSDPFLCIHRSPGSAAAEAGLEKDQFIVEINGRPVTALEIQQWALQRGGQGEEGKEARAGGGISVLGSSDLISDNEERGTHTLDLPASLSHSPFQPEAHNNSENPSLATAGLAYFCIVQWYVLHACCVMV